MLGLRPFESEVPPKWTQHSLYEWCLKIVRAQFVRGDSGEQEPLEMIAFHVTNLKTGFFQHSPHTPEQKEILAWLNARAGIVRTSLQERVQPGEKHSVKIVFRGDDPFAFGFEHPHDLVAHPRRLGKMFQ